MLERLAQVGRQILAQWQPGRSADQQRAEIQALSQTTTADAEPLASDVVENLARGRSIDLRHALACYLVQIPATIRRALRRPGDPAGLTVPADLAFVQPEDLLLLLPIRRPRYEPGMQPLAEAPWQIEELLGVGALSEVWKARDLRLSNGESVALKFCVDPASAKVLRNEAKSLDRSMFQARHPGIVTVARTSTSVPIRLASSTTIVPAAILPAPATNGAGFPRGRPRHMQLESSCGWPRSWRSRTGSSRRSCIVI